jgi:RND family efflux transporter MFP subunit
MNPSIASRRAGAYCASIAGLLGFLPMLTADDDKAAPPPPPEVQVITAAASDVPVTREWVATLDGTVNAAIHAQVAGYITRLVYQEGAPVKKGDLLFEIDARPFIAALAQAKAELAQAQAQLGKAQMDVKRYTPLAATDAISQQELDDAVQAELGARAKLEAGRAAQEKAEIDLGFTKMMSPIDGIAGFAKVGIGDLVGPGTGELTTISQVDPIRAYFTPSEREYLTYLARQRAAAEANTSKNPEAELTLILADGSMYPEKGKVLFADRQVDGRTGAIKIASGFPNPGGRLRPGMFARLQAVTETRKGVLVVPQRAVREVQGAYQLVVISSESKAEVRPVTLAERYGSGWVVLNGLKAGEQVVVEGLQKARPGSVVKAVPFTDETAAETPMTAAPATNEKKN